MSGLEEFLLLVLRDVLIGGGRVLDAYVNMIIKALYNDTLTDIIRVCK